MKIYETGRLLAEPFLPPLYKQVRSRLRELIISAGPDPSVLDVGGRKSPYTIGLDARITVIDLPRQSDIQHELNLGISEGVLEQIKKRRSNIDSVVLGDMTCSSLPDEKFDIAVSVEVLEHVERDVRFVSEVSRVLKPGGVFIMTTPNGDWVENKNPDHKRHYLRNQLSDLLCTVFEDVTVEYAIEGGSYRKMGLKPWSVQHPIQTAGSILGNLVNSFQSSGDEIKSRAVNTHHLIAIARKSSKKGYRGIF